MSVFYNISTLSDDPAGIKIIENPTKTLKAVLFPREYLSEFNRLEESNQAGVYILYNTMDKNEQPHIYIGQTGYNITSRLSNHNRNKDFWNQAIVFVEKGDFLNLNSAHAKIIESILIKEAGDCGAVVMDNSTGSRPPRVQKADELAAQTWADEVITITKILGLAFFIDQRNQEEKDEADIESPEESAAVSNVIPDGIYTMDYSPKSTEKTYHGIMEVRKGSFYLKEGSGICLDTKESFYKLTSLVELRETAHIENEILKEDLMIGSPSACGAFVTGRSCNGWTAWKNENGQFIDVYRK